MEHPKIIYLDEIDSTNRFLHDYAGVEPVVVATARHQTAGRGQGGNHWEDRADANLLFSILIHPGMVPGDRQFVVAMADALALREALAAYTDDLLLKWPNDIYWHHRKLSGTLIETALSGGRLRRMIIGTGVNINQHHFCSDAPNPVSLCQIVGHEVPVSEVLDRVLTAFGRYYDRVVGGDYETISREYHAALYRRSGLWPYRDSVGYFRAVTVGILPDGHLQLRDTDGRLRQYGFREVSFVLDDNNNNHQINDNDNGKI